MAHKGVGETLEAASMLVKKGITKFSIDFYGDGEICYYQDQAILLGIRNHVKFHGPKDQSFLYTVYSSTHYFLFPTWNREPFGFAPVEAASSGCVPIITDLCGAAERLVDRVHCIKIKSDARSLYKAMEEAINHSHDYEGMSSRCQQICRSSLSLEFCLNQISDYLTTIFTEQRACLAASPSISPEKLYNIQRLKHLKSAQLFS